ncbi:helix-turn-helix domain-containing protein [Paracoccus sp. 11-3]|uniref:Helix-turn-helix domain-containing protein n=1 Tax=Paracoccus amoyensis TaxID=2760093 RepID=A0A926GGP7_9RHOB|nr:helix-turn-helix domain-containing protein [Paracoccus amoyensis]
MVSRSVTRQSPIPSWRSAAATTAIAICRRWRWSARWSDGGLDALADRSPLPRSVWNRIPDTVRDDVVDFALEHEDLTPRELAVKYTDEKRYFVSKSSVYRILSAEDLITAPAHVVIRAADEFRDKTTRPNELWQTDFTHLSRCAWHRE